MMGMWWSLTELVEAVTSITTWRLAANGLFLLLAARFAWRLFRVCRLRKQMFFTPAMVSSRDQIVQRMERRLQMDTLWGAMIVVGAHTVIVVADLLELGVAA